MSANAIDISAPSFLKIALETRFAPELWAYTLTFPLLQSAPRGDGHAVMVFPGLMASDFSTIPLRMFLGSRGYDVHGWGQGRNYGRGIDRKEGVTPRTNVYSKLLKLQHQTGRKVSLIGWSLGGIYARELAKIAPHAVRQVITLGSPFNDGHKANNVRRLFEQFSGTKVESFDRNLLDRVKSAPPVPSTAIYSRTDGVVAWQTCVDKVDETSENVEVEGSHTGLGHNPTVLWVIADRLAQNEGQWEPFKREGLRRLAYYNPNRKTPY